MENDLAEALLDFYQKILKPEFDALKGKLAEHDEKVSQIFCRLDAIGNRLGRVEDQALMMNNGINRIEQRLNRIEGRIGRISVPHYNLC